MAVIPARGGSKGIKNKNIIDVHGRPLIDYTTKKINSLKKEGFIKEVIVSTDSIEIKEIVEKQSMNVPFIRPDYLSSDTAKMADVILHSVKYLEGKGMFFNAVMTLQVTSPMRSEEDIKGAIDLYNKADVSSLVSMCKIAGVYSNEIYKKFGDLAIPFSPEHNQGIRRQDSESIYVRNGAVYITDINYLKEKKSLISDKPLIFEMSQERSININTVKDLEKLRWMLCE